MMHVDNFNALSIFCSIPNISERNGQMTVKSTAIDSQTCPNCEFERRTPGKTVAVSDDVMHCTVCNSRWKTLDLGAKKPSRNPLNSSRQRILRPANTIDHRVFGKQSQAKSRQTASKKPLKSTATPLQIGYHPQSETHENPFKQISRKFYLLAALIPIIALTISVVISNSGHSGFDDVSLSDVTMKKRTSRQGTIAIISGKLSNSSGKSLPAPDLELVLLTKAGQKLREWRYSPPVTSISQSSNLVFETTIGNVPKSAERVSIILSEKVSIAQR